MTDFTIVIPVYNSEKIIGSVVKRINAVLFRKSYEIILVNDGSPDETNNVCEQLLKLGKIARYIELSRNFGQHNAIMAGLNKAKGEFVLCMDDDGQTPPEEIPKLIKALSQSKHDVVYGVYKTKRHSFYRRFVSRLADLFLKKLIDKPACLETSSFFIMRRFVKDALIEYTGPYPFLGGMIFRATGKIGNVEVEHKSRIAGGSSYNFGKLFALFINGFFSFSSYPVRFAIHVGIFFALSGFFFIIFNTIRYFFYGIDTAGWSSLISAVLLFGGIQLVFLGIVGEYVGRIFLTMNKKPQFVVRKEEEG